MSILNEKIDVRFGVVIAMILAAAFLRLVPHPMNFAPIGAMALFGAAYFKSRWAALLVPLAALWLSDLAVTNIVHSAFYPSFTFFYEGFYWVYGQRFDSSVGFSDIEQGVVRPRCGSAIGAAICSFYNNCGSWIYARYVQDLSGLMASYIRAFRSLENACQIFYIRRCCLAV